MAGVSRCMSGTELGGMAGMACLAGGTIHVILRLMTLGMSDEESMIADLTILYLFGFNEQEGVSCFIRLYC